MTVQVQDTNSAVEFSTNTRVHVAINVSNLEASLPFYRTLFGQEPAKVRPGYAKFEVAEPPVNFTLNENPNFQPGGTISHFGIQVKSTGEVRQAQARFVDAKLATFEEEQVSCCYAVQDKVWVTDPDGNSWEVFVVTEADSPSYSPVSKEGGAGACCATTTEATALKGKAIPLASTGTGCC